jgi:hypothetical protein
MKQQHEKITGYRELSDAEIALMNEGKELAKQVGVYVDKLKASDVACDHRWVAMGATDLQKGFMSLARSIAKPTTF